MTYFITGTSDGLGRELAKMLLNDGEKVVGLSRSEPDFGAEQSSSFEFIALDLMDEKSIQNAAQQIINCGDKIIFINCAGVMAREDELTFDELERVYKTNATGPILLENLIFNKVREIGGDIINVISTSALRGDVKQPIYSSSKWALRGFTLGLSERFKDSKARAVSFVPGGFLSSMAEKIDQKIADPENWMPVEDVANQLLNVIRAPRNLEFTEVVVNRKGRG